MSNEYRVLEFASLKPRLVSVPDLVERLREIAQYGYCQLYVDNDMGTGTEFRECGQCPTCLAARVFRPCLEPTYPVGRLP